MRRRALLLACAWAAACAGHGGETRSGSGERPTRLRLPSDTVGLSGLGLDEEGALWAVAENQRLALRIRGRRVDRIAITGVPEDLEVESIAALGPGAFALGTESDRGGRPSDAILFAELHGQTLRARPGLTVPYELWGMVGAYNEGIEGLCQTNGTLVLACEITSRDEDGQRFAPIARRRINGAWDTFRLPLSTAEGKVSALSCRGLAGGRIEVHAIERHFGVMRMLRAVLPADRGSGELTAELLLDLDAWVEARPAPPNFEGLELLPDGRAVMVVDNYHRGRTEGPSELWWFPLDAPRPRAPVPRATTSPASLPPTKTLPVSFAPSPP